MTDRLSFQLWLQGRSQRDKVYILIISMVFIYLLYFIFFQRSQINLQNEIQVQITALQTERNQMQEKLVVIASTIKNPDFLLMIEEQKKLLRQLNKVQERIAILKPKLFDIKELPLLTKKILEQQRNNIGLISLQELPEEPWLMQKDAEKNSDKKNTRNDLANFSNLHQHTTQIEFQNDYLRTIDYLQNLEKISSKIYWDSFEYKVLRYPKANIVLKFYVLSS